MYKKYINNLNKTTGLNFDWILNGFVIYTGNNEEGIYYYTSQIKNITNIIINCFMNDIHVCPENSEYDLFITIPNVLDVEGEILIKSGYLSYIKRFVDYENEDCLELFNKIKQDYENLYKTPNGISHKVWNRYLKKMELFNRYDGTIYKDGLIENQINVIKCLLNISPIVIYLDTIKHNDMIYLCCSNTNNLVVRYKQSQHTINVTDYINKIITEPKSKKQAEIVAQKSLSDCIKQLMLWTDKEYMFYTSWMNTLDREDSIFCCIPNDIIKYIVNIMFNLDYDHY
jgi:hypothetical protein